MSYDITQGGTPAQQGIVPPFTNLPANCYEINGVGQGYNWNFETGQWV